MKNVPHLNHSCAASMGRWIWIAIQVIKHPFLGFPSLPCVESSMIYMDFGNYLRIVMVFLISNILWLNLLLYLVISILTYEPHLSYVYRTLAIPEYCNDQPTDVSQNTIAPETFGKAIGVVVDVQCQNGYSAYKKEGTWLKVFCTTYQAYNGKWKEENEDFCTGMSSFSLQKFLTKNLLSIILRR